MSRFNLSTIARYTINGIYLKGDNFNLLPYDDMDEKEKKWVLLFKRGEHNKPDFDDEKELSEFDIPDFNDNEYYEEDELCEQMTNLMSEDDEKGMKMKMTGDLMSDIEISQDMVSVATLLTLLTEQQCPNDLMLSLYSLIKEEKDRLTYGEQWVKMNDVEKRLNTIVTTPTKKKMTDDEREMKLKKMTEEKEKRVVKMGLGDTKEKIGEVMRILKESVDVDSTSTTTNLDEMEKVVCDGMNDVEMMVNYVAHIEVKLAHANNTGVRLVTLRGQIFALYLKINPNATNVEIGKVFGVSSGIVSTSMNVARLVVEYPAFGRVTLPFTIIVRNLKRIRKWLESAGEDDKIFWGTD